MKFIVGTTVKHKLYPGLTMKMKAVDRRKWIRDVERAIHDIAWNGSHILIYPRDSEWKRVYDQYQPFEAKQIFDEPETRYNDQLAEAYKTWVLEQSILDQT